MVFNAVGNYIIVFAKFGTPQHPGGDFGFGAEPPKTPNSGPLCSGTRPGAHPTAPTGTPVRNIAPTDIARIA